MTSHIVPLVGMHFRPPAKAILSILPSRTPLRVVPEPDNPHDANALRVEVAREDIPADPGAREALASAALPFGFDLPAIDAEDSWHLGYIKATEAAWLAPLVATNMAAQYDDQCGGESSWCPGSLAFDSTGKPAVRLELP